MSANLNPQPGRATPPNDPSLAAKLGLGAKSRDAAARRGKQLENEAEVMDRQYTLAVLMTLLRR